ncbi:MAG: WYL domain-containing transcriptional regulator [Candidatus Dadabacteria bacterium]|nr:WYL domain-containing transcriptional regulator [Candidatus Dadabacteria bacterium]NIS10067.1 WYL domain-containing transcriptional regulator [Candidatus Dadabacteria bacterium]NIV42144.1 WYL domain-containing protein [Candidatus Dadabacteria bacterium]NIX16453.1 WYL domain-containing protein [Candidatus Dadabacteria bacterium]NIY23014.1 WYL domain-containing protein [Candidatus Dadabacteria bacterium]
MIDIPEPIGKYDRFYYLIECLSNHKTGVTVEEIAEAVYKSEKTVRRDLKSIEGNIFGINLIKDRGPDNRYRYRIEKQAATFRPLLLNTYEVLALYFIRGFAHFKDIPFMQSNLKEVFNKIDLTASEAKKNAGNDFFNRVSNLFILPRELGGKIYGERNKLNFLEKIIEAALDFRICEITYGKGNKEKEYRIAPLHFFNYRDAIYVLARNLSKPDYENENIIVSMALHRIKELYISHESFSYPMGFDVEEYFDGSLFKFEDKKHKIKLLFSPQIKDYILEREWYPNQMERLYKDGSVELNFESDINMILTGWIKGFGSNVKVLEPKELAEEIINDLKNNVNQYS